MILQFGTSRFLQAHVDLFASEARDNGQTVADIVIVQVSDDPVRARRLVAFDDVAGFPVVIRGLEGGVPVERTVQVRSVVRGLAAAHDWSELCALFVGAVTHVVSNTGDHGYTVPPEDRFMLAGDQSPRSFPAILLALLHRRWQFGGAGVTILPCELVVGNGQTLRATVLDLAEQLRLQPAFVDWLGAACLWVGKTIDRFANPFIEHRLADIYTSHAAKVAKRVGGFVDWVDARGSAISMPELRALAQRYEVKK